MTTRPAIVSEIAALFAVRNTHVAEVAIIQPADPFYRSRKEEDAALAAVMRRIVVTLNARLRDAKTQQS